MIGLAITVAGAFLFWWIEWYAMGLFQVGVVAIYGLIAQIVRIFFPEEYELWRSNLHGDYWFTFRYGVDFEHIVVDTKETMHDYPIITLVFLVPSFVFLYLLFQN